MGLLSETRLAALRFESEIFFLLKTRLLKTRVVIIHITTGKCKRIVFSRLSSVSKNVSCIYNLVL